MTHLKRLFALVFFVAVAVTTRMIVRYGVQGAISVVSRMVGLESGSDKEQQASKPKPKKPTQVALRSPNEPPLIQQGNKPAAPAPQPGGAPGQGASPALGPSAPSIAGPVNAARNAAAATNRQIAEETGQPQTPAKGAQSGAPPAAAPTPANTQAPLASAQAPGQQTAVQQGTPKPPAAATGTDTTPATGPKSGPAVAAANPKTGAAVPNVPTVKIAAPDTARRPVMREAFDYARDSRRDPFISLMTTSDLRPTITDLRLTGILYDLSGRRPVAILRDVAGGQWRVTTGMTLGRMRVSNIKPKVLIFTIEEFGFNRQDSLILGDTSRARFR